MIPSRRPIVNLQAFSGHVGQYDTTSGGFTVAFCRTFSAVLLLTVSLMPVGEGICGPVFDRVMKKGAVNLGLPYNRVPQGFIDPDGKWVGFEVDLATEMARHMNLKLEKVKVNGKTWAPMLADGRLDAAMCRIRHSRSLDGEFDFSVAYLYDAPRILVLKGLFKKPEQLKGHKIAAVQGSVSEQEAMRMLRDAGDQEAEKNVASYPDRPSCFMALGREKVSGWMDTGLVLLEYASKSPGRFELIKVSGRTSPIAVVVPQNDSAWRDLINFTIQDIAADGSLKKIYDKWFGPNTPYTFSVGRTIEVWPE
jgi:polar amino acid transport system substrate-binding protein